MCRCARCGCVDGAAEHLSQLVSHCTCFHLLLLQYILHDWDEESCIEISKNCYQALSAHGKVIAIDNVLPEINYIEGGDFT